MQLGKLGAGFGRLGGSAESGPIAPLPSAARTYDFVAGAYTSGGSPTNAASAIVGTVRPFTDEFLGDNWGARTDPAYSNLYNVDLSTATDGVIGAGGAFPTGWAYINSTQGLTTEVTKISSTAIRLRVSGTASASGNLRLAMASTTGITVLGSTAYNIAFKCKQVGAVVGPTFSASGGSPFGKGAEHNTAAGAFVSFSFTVGSPIRSADGVTVPVTCPVTTPATGVRIQPIFAAFTIPISATVDYTVEISDIQITLGTGRMVYSGSSSGADDLSINNLSSLLSGAFTAITTVRMPPDVSTGSLLEIGSGNNRIEVKHSAYAVSVACVVGGVTTTTTVGQGLPWLRTRIGLTVRGGTVYASLNGKPAVSCGSAPSLSGMKLGNGTTGVLRGSVEDCTLYAAGAALAELSTKSTPSAMYDDFDRTDGALGTTWTGHAYMQTGTAASAVISGHRVVTTDSGGASTSAYFTVDLGAIPKIFGGVMAWENHVDNASAGLISTPNNTSPSAASGITAQSAHFLVSAAGLFAGKFLSDVLTDHQWNFASIVTQTKDGATLGTTVWKLRPLDGALAVRVHNGETEYFTDENYYALAGRYIVPESFWSAADPSRPIWAAWGAET